MESKPSAWGRLYKLRSYCPVPSAASNDDNPTMLSPPPTPVTLRSNAALFCAYVGALFHEHGGEEREGFHITNKWIAGILEYEIAEGSAYGSEDEVTTRSRMQTPRPKYISPSSSPTQSLQSSAGNRNVTANGDGGGENGRNAVSVLNELATKRGKELFWDGFSSGAPHLSVWTVTLKLSGMC